MGASGPSIVSTCGYEPMTLYLAPKELWLLINSRIHSKHAHACTLFPHGTYKLKQAWKNKVTPPHAPLLNPICLGHVEQRRRQQQTNELYLVGESKSL